MRPQAKPPQYLPMRIAPLALTGILLLAALSGCAINREARVRSALTNAGLAPPLADCMAKPIARDLSDSQLRSLQRMANLAGDGAKDMTGGQILNTLQRSNIDPATVTIVVRASVGCFLRG